MSRSRGPRWSIPLLAAVVAVVPLCAACEAGQLAEVKREVAVAGGTYANLGNLHIAWLHLTPPQDETRITDTAYVWLVIYNMSQDVDYLQSITTRSGESAVTPTATPTAGTATPTPRPSQSPPTLEPPTGHNGLPIPLPPGASVSIAPNGNHELVIHGFDKPLLPGEYTKLTLTFRHAGRLDVTVPVTPYTGTVETTTPMAVAPTPVPHESIDPAFSKPPYDLEGSLTPPPAQETCYNPNEC